jgi:hypothetical protein
MNRFLSPRTWHLDSLRLGRTYGGRYSGRPYGLCPCFTGERWWRAIGGIRLQFKCGTMVVGLHEVP